MLITDDKQVHSSIYQGFVPSIRFPYKKYLFLTSYAYSKFFSLAYFNVPPLADLSGKFRGIPCVQILCPCQDQIIKSIKFGGRLQVVRWANMLAPLLAIVPARSVDYQLCSLLRSWIKLVDSEAVFAAQERETALSIGHAALWHSWGWSWPDRLQLRPQCCSSSLERRCFYLPCTVVVWRLICLGNCL